MVFSDKWKLHETQISMFIKGSFGTYAYSFVYTYFHAIVTQFSSCRRDHLAHKVSRLVADCKTLLHSWRTHLGSQCGRKQARHTSLIWLHSNQVQIYPKLASEARKPNNSHFLVKFEWLGWSTRKQCLENIIIICVWWLSEYVKKSLSCQVLVAHACNPSYSGGRDQDCSLKPAQANSSWDPISKNPITKNWAGGVAQGEGPEFKS
jgi:hypothetical protein